VLESDFFVVVTANFRVTYVFVVLEVGTRRILHSNDGTSDSGMDGAAVSDDRAGRPGASIRDP
jgi:hypothetical protein